MTQGLYLYCLARISRLPHHALEGYGLDGCSPLQLISHEDLAAVASPVRLADYCGSEAAACLQDLNWIGPRLVRHQEIVARVMRHSPVLPVGFGTIFSAATGLEGLLQRRHGTIARYLDYFTGQEEWAVKGLLDRAAARARLVALNLERETAGLAQLSPGKRYFEEQRLRAATDQELSRWLQEVRRELWHGLRPYATEVRERRLLSRETTGGGREMIMNWAFLIAAESRPDFQARLQAANSRSADWGLALDCTGPWPPYSFCPALESEPEP